MITIIIPALNEQDTIAEVIKFCYKEPLVNEVIVVDDERSLSTASVLVLPEVLEPRRRQLRVSHRVLDVPVPEPVRQRPRIVAVIRELVAAAMAAMSVGT